MLGVGSDPVRSCESDFQTGRSLKRYREGNYLYISNFDPFLISNFVLTLFSNQPFYFSVLHPKME